jgi:hypothetical protein
MGLIAKLLGAASKDEFAGAEIGLAPAWSAHPIKDGPTFFRALPELLPSGSVLYLEDVCSREGVELATRLQVEPQLRIRLNTIWPRSNFFHLPASAASLAELAHFAENHATPELAIHICAYHGNQVLLEWHDAFTSPLRLATILPEASVRHFCGLLHCNYERETPEAQL